jgi:hypothetical protein
MGRAEEKRKEHDEASGIERTEESSRPSRSEQARQIVEEYAKDLREIIKILRRRLFN